MLALSLGCLAAPGLRAAEQQGWKPPEHPRDRVDRKVCMLSQAGADVVSTKQHT